MMMNKYIGRILCRLGLHDWDDECVDWTVCYRCGTEMATTEKGVMIHRMNKETRRDWENGQGKSFKNRWNERC